MVPILGVIGFLGSVEGGTEQVTHCSSLSVRRDTEAWSVVPGTWAPVYTMGA